MIDMPEPIQKALDAEPEGTLRVLDPRNNRHYVLIPEPLYEQVKGLFGEDRLSEAERRAILQGVWNHAAWDDPAMDDYATLLTPKNQ